MGIYIQLPPYTDKVTERLTPEMWRGADPLMMEFFVSSGERKKELLNQMADEAHAKDARFPDCNDEERALLFGLGWTATEIGQLDTDIAASYITHSPAN